MNISQMTEIAEGWLTTFVLNEWTFYQLAIIADGYDVASFNRTDPLLQHLPMRIASGNLPISRSFAVASLYRLVVGDIPALLCGTT